MSWSIEWTGPARRDLRRLDRDAARRVVQAIERFASAGQGDVKRLVDREGELRLRVGQWRVRFSYDDDAGAIRILRVLPRDSAYRE